MARKISLIPTKEQPLNKSARSENVRLAIKGEAAPARDFNFDEPPIPESLAPVVNDLVDALIRKDLELDSLKENNSTSNFCLTSLLEKRYNSKNSKEIKGVKPVKQVKHKSPHVEEIRSLHGIISVKEISSRFGVSERTVRRMFKRS